MGAEIRKRIEGRGHEFAFHACFFRLRVREMNADVRFQKTHKINTYFKTRNGIPTSIGWTPRWNPNANYSCVRILCFKDLV